MTDTILIDGEQVKITNPEKVLWPEVNIRKIDFIATMIKIGKYILPHAKDRLLTTIRYPDGVNGKSFYQKNIPDYAPDWVNHQQWNDINYIVLNKASTLAWLGNQAALELHTSFNVHQEPMSPTSLVFDLDPSEGQTFDQVVEVALIVYETLNSLGIEAWIKTSGATGLQIYIPTGNQYTYDQARKINQFFGMYFSEKYPNKITIERMVNKRGKKLYFDYLQMWHGKTITLVYSPRARKYASVSMPVAWDELKNGIKPEDFTLLNVEERLMKKGDLFAPLLEKKKIQSLKPILQFIKEKNI